MVRPQAPRRRLFVPRGGRLSRVHRLSDLGALAVRVAAAAALAALCFAPVHADTHWTYAASSSFEVYTTGGESVARKALEDFSRAQAYFEQVLRIQPLPAPPTRVIVFSGRAEFAPYASNAGVKAFYQSNIDGDFIVLPSLGGDVLRAVTHEYTHLASRRAGKRYPLWLDDGLAEYFSTITAQGGRLRIGAAPQERLRSLGLGMRLMPLEQLFAVTRDSADYNTPARADMFYAEGWALTHMLLTDDRYRDRSGALLDRLANGEPSALALTTVYGKPASDVFRDLGKYALRGNFRTTLVDVALPATTSDAATRPASDLEAGVVLASLLGANPNRREDARAAFDALEREHADDLSFNEAAAMFEVRAGQPDIARPYLTRAIALNSANPRIYSHYAEILAASRDDKDQDDEEAALFAKALALGPDDVEVRIQAARSLVRRRRGADAWAMLAPVTRVPTEYEAVFADAAANAKRHSHERVADGRLTNVICDGDTRVIELETSDGTKRFVHTPRAASDDIVLTLPCGSQENRAVRIGYEERTDAAHRTDGTVLFVTIR